MTILTFLVNNAEWTVPLCILTTAAAYRLWRAEQVIAHALTEVAR